MASDSPRTRIDQFYASKKRKPVSPGLKSGRNGKEAKPTQEGSPSAKATLDNYLVTSQENSIGDYPSHIANLLARADLVKRRLSEGLASYTKNEHKEPPSALVPSETSESVEAIPKGDFQATSEAGSLTVGGSANDGPVAQCAKNSELKQFAANFLSLYCSSPSEPKGNDQRRQYGPTLPMEEVKASKKKSPHITSQLYLDGANDITNKMNGENRQSGFVLKGGASAFSSSEEVNVGHDSVLLKASLKKCSKAPTVHVSMAECQTPASLTVNARARETPQSMRGSSMISPGEAFWNEAIDLVDGLCAPIVNVTAQSAEESNCLESHCNIKNSSVLEIGICNDKLKGLLNEGQSRVRVREIGAPAVSLWKDTKELSKDVSPLLVKHLDFSTEEKKLDESSPLCCVAKDAKVVGNEGGERGSVNYNGVHKTNIKSRMSKSQTNEKSDTNVKGSISNHESTEPDTPSSFVGFKDHLDLSSWLPAEICSIYKKRGITKLYPWQVDCLRVDGVLQIRNLVYCASTSAGKSFVAEILMLRRVISTGKMALLVLPYVSICAEKAEHLETLLEPLNRHVRSYYGNQGGGTLPKDTTVAVCTIEKANSLINRLLEEGRLSEIGIIVIDELHMVGDRNRGYLLELMLTKLRYAAGEGNSESSSGESSGTSSGKVDPAHGLQIVGMSATMPNVAAVADWLQAALYQTDFRPVPLEEYIKVGNTIYDRKMDVVRTISKAADLGGKDPDHIVELCNEVVQEGHSVLIFCSSRKGCESTARHVSKFIKKLFGNVPNENSEFVDISSAIDALRKCPAGLDPVLEETLPCGVAYHHAGLTVEEREVVETCYRKGLIRVLTATSTLAAGVNLPARRVIFRQPRIGRDFIDGTRYRQMAGRAGRTGIDTKGESVLICKPEEVKRITGLLNENCPPLNSCLSEDKNGMTHAILEVVAGGIVQTAADINRYVRCTLLNSTKPFQDVVKSAQESLRWLCHKKFLEWNEDAKLYSTTPLGRASFGSSLSPEESLVVLDDLSRAREGFVLASDLHIVYLVTPINVDVEPDWELYYERFMRLSTLDQSVGNRVGVAEPFLMRMAHGAPLRSSNSVRNNVKWSHSKRENRHGVISNSMVSEDQSVRVCKRFYVALILSRLVQESPVPEVCETFKVARGMVQALQESAGRFASMVSVFCERLGWHDLEGLVAKFQNRVSFGVRAEIVELTTIPFVKGSRARALYKAGLRTSLAIAEASITELVKALFESSSWTTEESSAQRRMQMGIAKKIKHGARKIVLDKAEEARIAAFSAFKSLGFDVPQIALPLSSNPTRHGSGTTAPGIDTINSLVAVEHTKHIPMNPCITGSLCSDEVASQSEGEKLRRTGTIFPSPAEINSTCIAAENHQMTVEGSAMINFTIDHTKIADTNLSVHFAKQGDESKVCDAHFDKGLREQHKSKMGRANRDSATEKSPVNAVHVGGFDSFLDLWDMTQEFYFDVHYNKRSEANSSTLFELRGMAICWENSPVYYVNLPKDLLWSESRRDDQMANGRSGDKSNISTSEYCYKMFKNRWNKINEIMAKRNVRKFTWNLKVQILVLKSSVIDIQRLVCLNSAKNNMGQELIDGSYFLLSPVHISNGIDICILAWILWPDDERSSNPNLEKEVKKRLPSEEVAAANRSGQWKNQMRRAAHNGCCRRVAQIRALCAVLWRLIISEELVEALMNIEIPLVNVLADMELWGIGVNLEGCHQARSLLGKKLRCLEKEAYKLAGMTFSLYTAADIANVLYTHLKLPVPEGHKGKQHPSTDKHSLDLLRHEHPIIPVIKEHRTLAKLFNCTLGSICSLARLSIRTQKYTLHGHWLQTSTATGRLSMEEPNLQCVEHMVDFEMKKDNEGDDVHRYKVNARDFFVPTQDNWLLLTADYSQIELRMMAHFSKDSSLIELLKKPDGDVFSMIAARWTGRTEDSIGSYERDQTKRLIYGILYGMGAKSLAEQLECSRDEAVEKIQSFKSSFPAVSSWLHEAVAICRQKGYVETLKGRKRFLSKIKFGNSEEKSKAQRQAVNSICQGSAADVIKIAMISIYSVIVGGLDMPDYISSHAEKFNMLRGQCRILLQVHDELVLEVDPSVVKEAALLLQISMENAASLLVPLRVKLKVGRTWGSLEPYMSDQR